MAWNQNSTSVTVGVDKRISTLYWGKLAVSRSVTRTEEIVTYVEGTFGRTSTVASRETIATSSFSETKEAWAKAVSTIVTTIEELRGKGGEDTGTPSRLTSIRLQISLPAVNYSNTSRIDTLRDRVISYHADASTAEVVLPECRGTSIAYSARRVNEADGWMTTKTTTEISTSVTGDVTVISE